MCSNVQFVQTLAAVQERVKYTLAGQNVYLDKVKLAAQFSNKPRLD